MADRKRINVLELKTRIDALIRDYPDLELDEDLKLGMLEGETDLFDVFALLVTGINDQATMQEAIKWRISDLTKRRDRYVAREEACRRLAKELMDVAQLRKVVLPEATLSIRPGNPKVVIVDEALIPKSCYRIKQELNLSAIKDVIKDGGEVPGAVLNNSPDYLTILTK